MLNDDHPYAVLFGERGVVRRTENVENVDTIWNRDPSYYAEFEMVMGSPVKEGKFRVVGLTSTMLPPNCTDPQEVRLIYRVTQGINRHH